MCEKNSTKYIGERLAIVFLPNSAAFSPLGQKESTFMVFCFSFFLPMHSFYALLDRYWTPLCRGFLPNSAAFSPLGQKEFTLMVFCFSFFLPMRSFCALLDRYWTLLFYTSIYASPGFLLS